MREKVKIIGDEQIKEIRTCDFCHEKETPTVWHTVLMCKYCNRDTCKKCGKYCNCKKYNKEDERNYDIIQKLDSKIKEESLNTK